MENQNSGANVPPPINQKPALDLGGLDNYYQEEFKKIYESNESYKGKWNWFSFLFSWIWCFTKGCWAYALVILVSVILTFGIKNWTIFRNWMGNNYGMERNLVIL
jgi:hypothetical protein